MNDMMTLRDQELIDNAMASFIADVVISKGKKQQIRRNMECRRKLEEKQEAKKLQRETCEYEFEYLH